MCNYVCVSVILVIKAKHCNKNLLLLLFLATVSLSTLQ